MARIRTIKPEFFLHEGLHDAEQETGLPLRLAYIGLWTVCDREGRFHWRPRKLGTQILPYDDIDFSRVLDALATRGFVVKYASNGEEFGFVPSFLKHQVINNREKASEIPQPPENNEEVDACGTREPRVSHATGARTSGREGKGRERKGKDLSADAANEIVFEGEVIRVNRRDYERWQKAYHGVTDMQAELTRADDFYRANPPPDGKWFHRVSAWLEREHTEALAKKAPKDWRQEPEYRGALI